MSDSRCNIQWSEAHSLLDVIHPELGSLFYCSPIQALIGQPVRGGVPVLFPQFAERGSLPKHGLVRQRFWNQDSASQVSVHLTPDPDVGWYGEARLVLCVLESAQSNAITLVLQITNTGHQPFEFTGGLHPYFLVQDVQVCQVLGLQDCAYQDRYAAHDCLSEAGWISTAQAFERLYLQAPELILVNGQRRLSLSCQGFKEWMIWNCGQAGAQILTDLPDADWQKFLCIEPVIASQPVLLAPNAVFDGRLTIRPIG